MISGSTYDAPINSATISSQIGSIVPANDLSYTKNSVSLNFAGQNFTAGTTIKINVTFGALPVVTGYAPTTVEASQSVIVGTVSPGVAGDSLSLIQTGGFGTVSLSSVQNGVQNILYTAPKSVPTSAQDQISYIIREAEQGTQTAGSSIVTLDPGPALTLATPSPVAARV